MRPSVVTGEKTRWWMVGAGALLLVAAIGMWRSAQSHEVESERVEASAEQSLHRIDREIRTRAATFGAELNGRNWPETVDPVWFASVPRNPLTPGKRPWLEVASDEDAGLLHPRRRMALSEEDAAFWYNPARGIVRARVGPMISDAEALARYNRINESSVHELFGTEDLSTAEAAAARAEEDRAQARRKVPPRKRDSVVEVHQNP
ncbi:MAG TPA: hypothetical protein VG797_03615 [Phycisphaerales bacterium]|nr:hypothetical protein [Phycisphaerales bacterium]